MKETEEEQKIFKQKIFKESQEIRDWINQEPVIDDGTWDELYEMAGSFD